MLDRAEISDHAVVTEEKESLVRCTLQKLPNANQSFRGEVAVSEQNAVGFIPMALKLNVSVSSASEQ